MIIKLRTLKKTLFSIPFFTPLLKREGRRGAHFSTLGMSKALPLLLLFSAMTTAFTVHPSITRLKHGVTAHIIPDGCPEFHKLRMHLAERSADYASHIEDMYQEYKQTSSHRHSFIQASSKQARRRSRRLQRMHLNKLTNCLKEDI